MKEKGKKVTFRFTEEKYDSMVLLAKEQGYDNVSEFMRDGLDHFMNELSGPSHVKKVVVNVPAAVYERAYRVMLAGEMVSIENEIEKSFEEHVQKKYESILLEQNRTEKIERSSVKNMERTQQMQDKDYYGR